MTARGTSSKDGRWKAKYLEPAAPDTSELPELPEGWQWSTLDALATLKGGITKGQKPKSGERYIARLRQSILKWAFEGRLVDQDPTDEPASKLLERIRAEREAADPGKGRARQRETARPKVSR